MKKFLAITLSFITIFFTGCGKESKFGIEQFVKRMNNDFEITYEIDNFVLGENEDESFFFCKEEGRLTALSIDANNKIKGIALTLTANADIENDVVLFCKMCSVFTGNDYEAQRQILNDGKITADKINYADSTNVITVSRYKYAVVCNEYSVTMFCDKV